MTLHLQIVRDNCGSWSVYGLSPQPAGQFPSLSATIDYARRQCSAAPATIEVTADGCCAIVHQQEGWPRRLVGPEAKRSKRIGESGNPERSARPSRSGTMGSLA
ncbi:MAG: hypothetical protein JO081_06770 [Alphaproteobacteria bacterium]|nr:hypothetical protein [Alphaproteobacteria bacterium]